MRYSLVLLVALMVLSLGVRYFADPVRLAQASQDPGRDLHELCQRDPLLGPALDQADRGDITELATWINRAEPADRQRLAFLLLRLVRKPGAGDDQPLDSALCWKYRHRFRAFLNLDTGIEALDTTLDNLVAYTLVTGTDKPSPQDVRLARSLVPRLHRAATEAGDDSVMDTIGCVQFVAEDFVSAKESFAQAQRFANDARGKRPHGNETLYARRRAAAETNAKLKAEGRSAEYVALPPEEEPATPAETKKP